MPALHTLVHPDSVAWKRRALACALASALLLHGGTSLALGLGPPEVRSYLGQPLDVRIPIEGSGAEAAEASCFSVSQDRGQFGLLKRPRLEVAQQHGGAFLILSTLDAVVEPATIVRVRAACPGAAGILERQVGILLDPMPIAAPSVAPETRPLLALSTAPTRETGSASSAVVERPAPRAPRKARTAGGQASMQRVAQAAEAPRRTLRRDNAGYVLKLSAPALDFAPARRLDDADREQMRQARAILDSDDNTAAMLALQARVDALQREVAQLKALRTESQPAAGRAIPAVQVDKTPAAAAPAPHAMPWAWSLAVLAALLATLWTLRHYHASRRPEEPAEPAGIETGRFVARPPALEPVDAAAEAVAQAQQLYDAGERFKAAQVLRFAIEAEPERVTPWIPLFDLLRREGLATEFAELARGFRAIHGADPAWAKVKAAGREIDPGNALYQDDAEEALGAR